MVPETGIEPVRPLFTKRRILRTWCDLKALRFTSEQRLHAAVKIAGFSISSAKIPQPDWPGPNAKKPRAHRLERARG